MSVLIELVISVLLSVHDRFRPTELRRILWSNAPTLPTKQQSYFFPRMMIAPMLNGVYVHSMTKVKWALEQFRLNTNALMLGYSHLIKWLRMHFLHLCIHTSKKWHFLRTFRKVTMELVFITKTPIILAFNSLFYSFIGLYFYCNVIRWCA